MTENPIAAMMFRDANEYPAMAAAIVHIDSPRMPSPYKQRPPNQPRQCDQHFLDISSFISAHRFRQSVAKMQRQEAEAAEDASASLRSPPD